VVATQAATPGLAPQPSPTPSATQTPAPTPTLAAPSPTAFAGQVANAGGLGNTRSDFDTADGPPQGETPNHLVVYRRNNVESHVGFVPDLNGRAAILVQVPVQTGQLPTLEQAQSQAHALLPRDAQPPSPTAEGNTQFAVERYTSQTLAQALPQQTFTANSGQPGQFLVVYLKDPQGRIARWILGAGNNPNALIAQAD
jgi:hypothetical protein